MSNLSYPQIKADLDLCQTQLSELCQGSHDKAIMSVPPQATDFDMQISAAFDEVKAYRDTDLTPEEIMAAADRRHNCKIECLLEEYNKVVAERDTLKKALKIKDTALEISCEEIVKQTSECPTSLYKADMCENCNEDNCESLLETHWYDYFIQQAQEQEGEK